MLLSIDPSLNVMTAYLPSEALSLIESQPHAFDLVLLDFNMPEMNGLELAKKIRSNIPNENIVLLTATSAFATHSQEIPEGMHLIQKPISSDKLREALTYQKRNAS
jgi:two-component SAPR family response regulator